MRTKFIHVIGTRPNFIKLSPLYRELEDDFENVIIHTGQHYDNNMSNIFFKELDIPPPHYTLKIGGGSQSEDTGKSLIEISKIIEKEKPDGVIVYGDVTATLSGALVASKMNIPIIHVESGSRSFDRKMPEEINRIIVDNISDILLCCDDNSFDNLKKEGIEENVFMVGNIAIDTFKNVYNKTVTPIITDEYILCTLHRPFNVDDIDKLEKIIKKIGKLPYKIIFPAHPRTTKNLEKIKNIPNNIKVVEPLGYKDFINHLKFSKFVISDSGGVQSECASVKKRLITLRPSTEHLLSVDVGVNLLCKDIDDFEKIQWAKNIDDFETPIMWDGKTSKRINNILKNYFNNNE